MQKKKRIDLHAHILWGLDDGASDEQETLAMLRESSRQGVTVIAATVHACPGFKRFDLDTYMERLAQAQALCRAEELDIELLTGAEIAVTYQTAAALHNRSVPTLGGSDYALIELWHNISWREAYRAVDSVLKVGCLPILSHVERYSCFVWEPKRALRFRRETGAMLQVNASALLRGGRLLQKRFLSRMLAEQGIDIIASDAHDMRCRPPVLGEAYRLLVDWVGVEYADRLTGFDVNEIRTAIYPEN